MFVVSRWLDESLNRDGQHKVHRYNRLDSPGKLNSQVNRMRRSETVGITEVQAMLRLVAETAELWYDPIVQRRYTLESLCRVLPAKAGICFTFGDILMGGDGACGCGQGWRLCRSCGRRCMRCWSLPRCSPSGRVGTSPGTGCRTGRSGWRPCFLRFSL